MSSFPELQPSVASSVIQVKASHEAVADIIYATVPRFELPPSNDTDFMLLLMAALGPGPTSRWPRAVIINEPPYSEMPVPVSVHPETRKKAKPQRHRVTHADLDYSKRIWSEAEAAAYTGYSVTTLARWRNSGDNIIPAHLYRQNARGGKICYYTKPFIAWFENQARRP